MHRIEAATRVVAGVEPFHELLGVERAGHGVALGDIAPDVAELLEDLFALDTFGDHLEAEVVSEVDRRPDDDLVLLVDQHVGDEALIHLQLADRELTQVAQRRVARAEIVDRQMDAEFVELLNRRTRAGRLEEQRRLGDLECERSGVHAVLRQIPGDSSREVRIQEVMRREVHRQREVVTAVLEVAQFDDALCEHGVGQLLDQTRVLGDSDEVDRGHLPASMVIPAREGFGAGDEAAGQVELRLVRHRELPVVERPSEIAEHREPGRGATIEFGAEELDADVA